MKRTLKAATACAAVAVAWSGIATTAEAAAPKADRYCVIVVGKAPKGKLSPVRSRDCSATRSARPLKAAAAGETLLIEWYDHVNNRPSSFTRVYGESGPCDRDGYRLRAWAPPIGYWGNKISGFNTWNSCSVVTGYDLVNISGDRQTWDGRRNPCVCVDVPWVGHRMNDRIESFWLRRHH